MKDAQFERLNHTTRELPKGERKVHASINAAKHWSREKQIALDGGLGRGSVRVVT